MFVCENIGRRIRGRDGYVTNPLDRDTDDDGLCCGAGGARMWMEERIGKRVNTERTEEAIGTGASAIAVGCPFFTTPLSTMSRCAAIGPSATFEPSSGGNAGGTPLPLA